MGTTNSGLVGGAPVTRALLWCGILAGPFYLVVGLAQAFLRDGFVFSKHPLSVLTNGPGGWIQTVNFVLTGLMVLAAAVGFGRVLGPKPRATVWFLAGYGVSILVASVFKADPMDGFPPGTPLGVPTTISTSGLVHLIAGALGFTFLAISCLFAAPMMRSRNLPSLALLSLLSGVAVALGFFGGILLPMGVVGIWFAVVTGWAWLTVMSLRLNPMR